MVTFLSPFLKDVRKHHIPNYEDRKRKKRNNAKEYLNISGFTHTESK